MLEPKFLLLIFICHSVIVTASTAEACLKLEIIENEFQSISAEFNRFETQLSFQKTLLPKCEHRTVCLQQYVNDLYKSDWTVRDRAPRIPGPNDGALLLDDLNRAIEDDQSCLEKVKSVASNFVLKSGAPFVAHTIESMIKRLKSMMTTIRSEINEIESDTIFLKGKGLKSELKELAELCLIEQNEEEAEITNKLNDVQSQIDSIYEKGELILSVLNNKGLIWQNDIGYYVEIYQGTYSSVFEDLFSINLRNGDLSAQIESVFDNAIMSSVSYGISTQCTLDAMYNDFISTQNSLTEVLGSEYYNLTKELANTQATKVRLENIVSSGSV